MVTATEVYVSTLEAVVEQVLSVIVWLRLRLLSVFVSFGVSSWC